MHSLQGTEPLVQGHQSSVRSTPVYCLQSSGRASCLFRSRPYGRRKAQQLAMHTRKVWEKLFRVAAVGWVAAAGWVEEKAVGATAEAAAAAVTAAEVRRTSTEIRCWLSSQ